MMEIVLSVVIPDNWMNRIANIIPMDLKLIDAVPDRQKGGRLLVQIDIEPAHIEQFRREMEHYRQVCRVDLSPVKEGGFIGSIVTDNCLTCQALMGSNCYLTSATQVQNGSLEWHLIAGDNKGLLRLVDFLKSQGCIVELKSKKSLSKKQSLTKRQEDVVRIALQNGYYDYPKRINLRKLSQLLEISTSTLNETLRRGEKKIISTYLG